MAQCNDHDSWLTLQSMMVVCDWEISEARKRDALDRARVRGEEPPPELVADDMGVHASVDSDVKRMLQGKSWNELDDMQIQIEAQMRSGTAKVVEYWEAVLRRLHIFKAKVHYGCGYIFLCEIDCVFELGSPITSVDVFILNLTYGVYQARLREIHTDLLRQHLERLQESENQDQEGVHEVEEYERPNAQAEVDVEGTFFSAIFFSAICPSVEIC